MPAEAYDEILDEKDGQEFIKSERLKLILFSAELEVLLKWIE